MLIIFKQKAENRNQMPKKNWQFFHRWILLLSSNCLKHTSVKLWFGFNLNLIWQIFQPKCYWSPPEEYSCIKGDSIYIESKLEEALAARGGAHQYFFSLAQRICQNLAKAKNFLPHWNYWWFKSNFAFLFT